MEKKIMFNKNKHIDDRPTFGYRPEDLIIDEFNKLDELNKDVMPPLIIPYDYGEDPIMQSVIYEEHEIEPRVKYSYGLTNTKMDKALKHCEQLGFNIKDLVLHASLASLTYLKFCGECSLNFNEFRNIVLNECYINEIFKVLNYSPITLRIDRVALTSPDNLMHVFNPTYTNKGKRIILVQAPIVVINCVLPSFKNELK